MSSIEPIVFAINGPPSAGKSTLAHAIVDAVGELGCEEKMAFPIDWGVKNALSIDDDMWTYLREEGKEGPIMLGSEGDVPTVRQVLINFSEDFLKPTFGPDIFGRLAADRIMNRIYNCNQPVIAISDCGFQAEFDHVARFLNEAGIRLVLVRCLRDGYTFAGDSREYVEPFDRENGFVVWENDSSPKSLLTVTEHLLHYAMSGT